MGRKLVAALITAALVSPSFVSAKPPPKFNKPPPEHIQKVGGPKGKRTPVVKLGRREAEEELKQQRKGVDKRANLYERANEILKILRILGHNGPNVYLNHEDLDEIVFAFLGDLDKLCIEGKIKCDTVLKSTRKMPTLTRSQRYKIEMIFRDLNEREFELLVEMVLRSPYIYDQLRDTERISKFLKKDVEKWEVIKGAIDASTEILKRLRRSNP